MRFTLCMNSYFFNTFWKSEPVNSIPLSVWNIIPLGYPRFLIAACNTLAVTSAVRLFDNVQPNIRLEYWSIIVTKYHQEFWCLMYVISDTQTWFIWVALPCSSSLFSPWAINRFNPGIRLVTRLTRPFSPACRIRRSTRDLPTDMPWFFRAIWTLGLPYRPLLLSNIRLITFSKAWSDLARFDGFRVFHA